MYCFFKHQQRGHCLLWQPSDYQSLLCNSYTKCIKDTGAVHNLGQWAGTMQHRICQLPFHSNPLLQMIRACSHVHHWDISAPVRGYVVCVILHVHLMCLYVGKTGDPLMTRLRKHWTTAKVGTEESPFYDMLCRTGIHKWTIAPLQFTTCAIRVCQLERDWWCCWRTWALNACAPAVPSNHDIAPPAPQHPKRFAFVMRQLHTARI